MEECWHTVMHVCLKADGLCSHPRRSADYWWPLCRFLQLCSLSVLTYEVGQ